LSEQFLIALFAHIFAGFIFAIHIFHTVASGFSCFVESPGIFIENSVTRKVVEKYMWKSCIFS